MESAHLDNELKQRQDLLEKIEAETRVATKEREIAEEVNREARRKLEDYRVPEVEHNSNLIIPSSCVITGDRVCKGESKTL